MLTLHLPLSSASHFPAALYHIMSYHVTSRLQPAHQPLPNLEIDDSTHAKCRHNAPDACQRALRPVPYDPARATVGPAQRGAGPVVQIEAQQVQRRAHELDRCGRDKLRNAGCGDVLADLVAHVCVEARCKERREVEAGEDCQAVAHGEESECGQGDRAAVC
jgi:hypothetical protein